MALRIAPPSNRWLLKSFLLALFILLSCTNYAARSKSKKLALLIGISNYPNDRETVPLHTEKDLLVLQSILEAQSFPCENIHLLQNEEATKANILEQIQTFLLAKSMPGSVVVIYFAGHGDQIPDDNQDEYDGKDEILLTYPIFPKKEKRAPYLRDDEIGAFLHQIRQKIGEQGEVLFLVDACHSGAISRGNTSHAKVKRGSRKRKNAPSLLTGTCDSGSGWQEFPPAECPLPDNLILISASRHDQISYEVKDEQGHLRGPLSWAFSKALAQVNQQTTYRSLFQRIRDYISRKNAIQSPQLEGFPDRKLFGGGAMVRGTYFEIGDISNYSSVIQGGILAGLSQGSIVELFPSDTYTPISEKVLNTGRVIQLSEFASIVKWDHQLTPEDKCNWVYIKEKQYGGHQARLAIYNMPSKRVKAIEKQFQKSKVVQLKNENPDLILEVYQGKIVLKTRCDNSLFTAPLNLSAVELNDSLQTHLRRYVLAQLIKAIDIQNRDLAIKLELIPDLTQSDDSLQFGAMPKTRFAVGEKFIFRVINQGQTHAFFNIIHIDDQYHSSIAHPNLSYSLGESCIAKGDTLTYQNFVYQFTDPGNAYFKIISSNKELDLRGILESAKTNRNPHLSSSLERLLWNFRMSQNRSAQAVRLSVGEIWAEGIQVEVMR